MRGAAPRPFSSQVRSGLLGIHLIIAALISTSIPTGAAKNVLFQPKLSSSASCNKSSRGGGIAPWDPQWPNSFALCSIMRRENYTDVHEWLQYYQWLGVDHVFLTENDPEGVTAAMAAMLEPFRASGFVTLREFGKPHSQLTVYRWCIEEKAKNFSWMGFLDLDEMLVVREKHQTLKGLLAEYKMFGGLGVHWVLFGSAGRKLRPPTGGVLRHYSQCNPKTNGQIKIIANTFYLRGTTLHPHNMVYRCSKLAVNEQERAFGYVDWKRQRDKRCKETDSCVKVPGWSVRDPSVDRIALFHYVTKSEEDFKIKRARAGGVVSRGKPFSYFRLISRRSQHTDGICAEGAALADQCCNATIAPAVTQLAPVAAPAPTALDELLRGH